jgi:V-type H+-transporting ATPase subunit a
MDQHDGASSASLLSDPEDVLNYDEAAQAAAAGAWSVFRSEEMSPIQICLPIDERVATSTIRALAATKMVQINDSNVDMPESKRRFKEQLSLCSTCLRYCRTLEDEVLRMDEESDVQLFERTIDGHEKNFVDLNEPFDKLKAWVDEINQHNFANTSIVKDKNALTEHAAVLLHAGEFVQFANAQTPRSLGYKPSDEDMTDGLLDVESGDGISDATVQYLTGVCVTRTAESFSRALFRALRGCVLLRLHHLEQEITDPATGNRVFKSAFAAVCTGGASIAKVKHIASGFNAHIYECPPSQLEREKQLDQCMLDITELDGILNKSKEHKLGVLRAYYQQCQPIKAFCLQERIVYHTLNMFKPTDENNFLTAECWIPTAEHSLIQKALAAGSAGSDTPAFSEPLLVDKHEQYPTFIRTNKFTAQFQAIVDTYGIPTYREANPAFFAVAMFPFLFGVMFADVVHGAMMLVFALALIMFEDRLGAANLGEIPVMLFNGRYMIMVMALCAIYMGFIYNEALSLSMTLWGPSAFVNEEGEDVENYGESPPYPFGVDPAWRWSESNIQFTNSLKMKMSVILGVTQMTVGIFLKLLNNIYFKRWLDVIVESVPELIFMSFTFGYMSLLVFRKWSIQYLPHPPDCFSHQCAGVVVGGYPLKAAPPMIITTMIKMFNVEPLEPENCLYFGQVRFQNYLLLCAVVALPILLLGKPLYKRREHNAALQAAGYSALATDPEEKANMEMQGYEAADGECEQPVADIEPFEFGEVFTHQAIHTIEFALGCVSNTASYLRLWALSLAHSQLSEVFYGYILHGYELCLFGYYPGIAGGTGMIVLSYAAFFAATIGILMGMESLSAFLHALRLQWVEFQSKFYDAQGILFDPLSLDINLNLREE